MAILEFLKYLILPYIDMYIYISDDYIGEKLTVTKHCWLYTYAILT